MSRFFRHLLPLTIGCVISLAAQGSLHAASRPAALPAATFAMTAGETSVPFGWVDFCARNRSECATRPLPALDVELTPAVFQMLTRVNEWANSTIEPVSDEYNYGSEDFWTYPANGKGDCEDYVLLKRRLLIEIGFPRQALLITVVKDLNGEGHAILTVKTSRGEFILDNKTNQVRAWTATGYRYVKRQSQEDPNRWVSLGEPGGPALAVSQPARSWP